MKLKVNLLLCGLIHAPCNENWDFWKHFPKVHVSLLPKRGTEREEEEKEKGGKEREEGHHYVKQDTDLVYRGNYFSESVDDEIFADMYGTVLEGRAIGKKLAMLMLENAFANYSRADKISEKLRHFLIVADTEDVSKLYLILSKAKDDDDELKIWKQHCKNLEKKNTNYVVTLMQPKIFNITQQTCFKTEIGCTDSDLRAILFGLAIDDLRVDQNEGRFFVSRKLCFQKIVKLLGKTRLPISGSWSAMDYFFRTLPLLLDPSDVEAEHLKSKAFMPSIFRSFRYGNERFEGNLEIICASESERRVLTRIANLNVTAMIINEYHRLPQGSLTDNFAVDIMNWAIGQFLQKFPDHFLSDTLKHVNLDIIHERWIVRLAEWYHENRLYLSENGLTETDSLRNAVANLGIHDLDYATLAVKARIVAETAGITDFEAQNLVAEVLRKHSYRTLSEIFQKLPTEQKLKSFVAQPLLFPMYEPRFIVSFPHGGLTLGDIGMASEYVLKRLREAPRICNEVLVGLLTKHKRFLHWKSQDDWATLEEALIQSDQHCYMKVELGPLNDKKKKHFKKALNIGYTQCVSFRDVEAAVHRKVKSDLRMQLEKSYAEKYKDGPPSQVDDHCLRAIVYFNRKKFKEAFYNDQDYKVAITKAFWSKLKFVPREIREELEKEAGLVCTAISDWYRLYTESGPGIKANPFLKSRSCLLYVLLRNEIKTGPNQKAYRKLLTETIDKYLFDSGPSGAVEEIMEHYQDVDGLRTVFEASLLDPASRFAMTQPLLNVQKPWSLADIRTAILEKAPNGLFRSRLMMAPRQLLLTTLNAHLSEAKHFFDPKDAGDWRLFESLMVKGEDNCALAVMQVSDLPFTVPDLANQQVFNTYEDVFNAIKDGS
jgi:hypothetical protein